MSARALAIGLMAAMIAGCAHRSVPAPPAAPAVVTTHPAPGEVLSIEPWNFRGHAGRLYRTHWYRVYTTEVEGSLVRRLPVFLESALEEYRTRLADLPPPQLKLDLFLMAGREEWATLTRQLMGDRAETYLRIERGGFSSGGRALLWNIGEHDTLAIAAHEGWHQYTQRVFADRLPVWLEEGIATHMEGFAWDWPSEARPRFLPWANVERYDQLRRALVEGWTAPLSALVASTPQGRIDHSTESTLTYYAQVWALVHFLREGEDGRYAGGLSRLVADAAAGRVPLRARHDAETLFRAYWETPLSRMEEEFAAFCVDLARAGARDLIVGGRSPVVRRVGGPMLGG